MAIDRMTLDEIFDMEAEYSPLVGDRTRVFLEQSEKNKDPLSPQRKVSLNKSELVNRISAETGQSPEETLRVVDVVFDCISHALHEGGKAPKSFVAIGKVPRLPGLGHENLFLAAKKAGFNPNKLAKICSISFARLESIFKKEVKRTPGEWLRDLRVKLDQKESRQTKTAARADVLAIRGTDLVITEVKPRTMKTGKTPDVRKRFQNSGKARKLEGVSGENWP